MTDQQYYEKKEHWNYDYNVNASERTRFLEIIDRIPKDTKTLVDIGCGNGSFLRDLVSSNRTNLKGLTGVDVSEEALKYVTVEKVKSSIDDIPIETGQFDVVTCLEVIEHLPVGIYEKGLIEIARISNKYIIISVPNEQDLSRSLVICPNCSCWFNPTYHVRSFNKETLRNLFPSFKVIEISEIGPIDCRRKYFPFFISLAKIWKKPRPKGASTCPQCAYSASIAQGPEVTSAINNKVSAKRFLLQSLIDLGKILVPIERKHRWLVAIYERK